MGLHSEVPLWYGKRGKPPFHNSFQATLGHTLYNHGSLLSMFKHAQMTPFVPQPLSLERILGSLKLLKPDGFSLTNLPSAAGTSAPSMTVGENTFSCFSNTTVGIQHLTDGLAKHPTNHEPLCLAVLSRMSYVKYVMHCTMRMDLFRLQQ